MRFRRFPISETPCRRRQRYSCPKQMFPVVFGFQTYVFSFGQIKFHSPCARPHSAAAVPSSAHPIPRMPVRLPDKNSHPALWEKCPVHEKNEWSPQIRTVGIRAIQMQGLRLCKSVLPAFGLYNCIFRFRSIKFFYRFCPYGQSVKPLLPCARQKWLP